jgi:hypothetical protein
VRCLHELSKQWASAIVEYELGHKDVPLAVSSEDACLRVYTTLRCTTWYPPGSASPDTQQCLSTQKRPYAEAYAGLARVKIAYTDWEDRLSVDVVRTTSCGIWRTGGYVGHGSRIAMSLPVRVDQTVKGMSRLTQDKVIWVVA